MLLAIDTGNTNTLFAVHDGNEWRAQWRSAISLVFAGWPLPRAGLCPGYFRCWTSLRLSQMRPLRRGSG